MEFQFPDYLNIKIYLDKLKKTVRWMIQNDENFFMVSENPILKITNSIWAETRCCGYLVWPCWITSLIYVSVTVPYNKQFACF